MKLCFPITGVALSLLLCLSLCSGCAGSSSTPSGSESLAGASSSSGSHAEGTPALSGELILLGPGKFTEVGPNGATDPVTGLAKPGYNEVIELFEAEYPDVTLKVEAIPWDSYQAKMQTAAAGNMVDVLLHGAVILDAAEDLNTYIEQTPGLVDQLFLGTAVRHKYDDNYDFLAVTGIPATISPAMLMLDTQIFADFGVEVPTADTLTWENLPEIAARLTGTNPRTGEQNYGFYPFGVGDGDIWKNYMTYNWATDTKVLEFADRKADTKLLYNTPESIASLTYLNQLFQYTPRAYLEGLGADKRATENNDVAIYMSENLMQAYDQAEANGIADRFLFLPIPKTLNGDSYASLSGDWNLAIAASSSRKDLAWEFIKFMVTDPEVQDWFISINAVPNNKAGFEKYMTSGKSYLQAVKLIYSTYPQDFCYSSCEYWNNSIGPSNSVGSTNLSEMFAGKLTPEECAAQIQTGMEEYMASIR